jgi:hypothetical protein
MHLERIRRGCPLPLALALDDLPMLMVMLRRHQRRGVRVLRPPGARREGVHLSRCHEGASGGERRGRSGCVQLDVGAGGVQRGYGHRHGIGLVLLLMRVWLLLVHSVEAPSGWDPGNVALQENGDCRKGRTSVQEARVMVYR